MSFDVNGTTKTQRELPPAGMHLARCYSIIDLGVQTETFQNQTKKLAKVNIAWELTELPGATFDQAKGPQPFGIFQEYTVSLADKAKLPKVLCAWGKMSKITNLNVIEKFINAPCMLNVIHKEGKNGITYANVYDNGSGVSPIMQGQTPRPLRNPTMFFTLDKFSWAEFQKIPKFLQEKIRKCDEWQSILQKYGQEPVQQQNNQQQNNQQQQNAAPSFNNQAAQQQNTNFMNENQNSIPPGNGFVTQGNDAPSF